jgi:hypothetical protein
VLAKSWIAKCTSVKSTGANLENHESLFQIKEKFKTQGNCSFGYDYSVARNDLIQTTNNSIAYISAQHSRQREILDQHSIIV